MDKEVLNGDVGLLLIHVVQISVTDMLLPCYNHLTFVHFMLLLRFSEKTLLGLLQMRSDGRENHSVSFPVKCICPELLGLRFELFYLFYYN